MDHTLQIANKYKLVGLVCSIEAEIVEIQFSNIYTKSKKNIRNWKILVKNVIIDSKIKIDHLWLFGCKKLKLLLTLDYLPKIKINGKIGIYEHEGIQKFTLKFPYNDLKILNENHV